MGNNRCIDALCNILYLHSLNLKSYSPLQNIGIEDCTCCYKRLLNQIETCDYIFHESRYQTDWHLQNPSSSISLTLSRIKIFQLCKCISKGQKNRYLRFIFWLQTNVLSIKQMQNIWPCCSSTFGRDCMSLERLGNCAVISIIKWRWLPKLLLKAANRRLT